MPLETRTSARRAMSLADQAERAVAEVVDQLEAPPGSLVLFFTTPRHDRAQLAAAWNRLLPDRTVIGCTTAGEIGPGGLGQGSLSACALMPPDFNFEVFRIDGLQDALLDAGTLATQRALARLGDRGDMPNPANTFALALIDGLSVREETVVSSLHRTLRPIRLCGGSAGDDLDFQSTQVFHDGRFHDDAAVVALVQTRLPFEVFRSQHFVETDQKLVVTAADSLTRVVTEINGEPAAREYARRVGLEIEELTPMTFASHPVMVRVGGETFVRSIVGVNPDESLTFFCAIEPGIVLTVARGIDIVGGMQQTFDALRGRVGEPALTIGFDCILRRLEGRERGIEDERAAVFERNRTVGFSTYGEQIDAMHVNQTLTGVMIGQEERVPGSAGR